MDGVILFADDKLMDYTSGDAGTPSHENLLFRKLSASNPVLGVKERNHVERSINSVGTFSAIILDWQFDNEDKLENDEDDETASLVQTPSSIENKTFDLLMKNEFYSLVYIYSTAKEEIEARYGEQLREKYKDRIEFRDKSNLSNTEEEAQELLSAIDRWKENNKKIAAPISWSQSINRSVQSIFASLNQIDPNWIKELHETARKDGAIPSVEVINLFQDILSERIIQDRVLREKIDEVANSSQELTDSEKYAELIRILYYGYSCAEDPIMTGDIFRLNNGKYGIIITPECDIRHVTGEKKFELLCFSKGDYSKSNYGLNAKIKAGPIVDRAEVLKTITFSPNEREKLSQELNNQIKAAENKLQIEGFTQTNNPRLHILPCFEFEKNNYSGIALIDFRVGLDLIEFSKISVNDRVGKLNTPYIQELRQRYLAYKGRVGVAGYSVRLREWLLSKN